MDRLGWDFKKSGSIKVEPNLLVHGFMISFSRFKTVRTILLSVVFGFVVSIFQISHSDAFKDPNLDYKHIQATSTDLIISRSDYNDGLHGFWLGQSIANWTGLTTENNRIGVGKTGDFYTRDDWGKLNRPSNLQIHWKKNHRIIDYVFKSEEEIWGADDDTDIEYMYQHLTYHHSASILSADQIRQGWMRHIKKSEPNYLWVSNEAALHLMHEGLSTPETGSPTNNPHFDMIDAQLTTEIFGLFAPASPEVALDLSYLPIRVTAHKEAAWIAEFYVVMHSLASSVDRTLPMKEQIFWMADRAREYLPNDSYPAKMFDFVKKQFTVNSRWEDTRDQIYMRYQLEEEDGYTISSRNLYCNGCFAAGINYAASLVSLFYGEGDLKETIKIGTLAGWDSDNPTATWGGLLGFMLGKDGIEEAFERKFSDKYHIHRTRQAFPLKNGIDSFDAMAKKGVFIVDRIVQDRLGGGIDFEKGVWVLPNVDPKSIQSF